MAPRLLAAARALTFRTRQVADPEGFVRTFGAVVAAGPGPLAFGEADAIDHAHPSPPAGCARGKVAAFARRAGGADAVCWQLSDDRTEARIVGCCNATAAVAAVCADPTGRSLVRMKVSVPGPHRVAVDATVGPAALGIGRVVRQAWTGLPAVVPEERRVLGRRCAIVVGPFNDYLVLGADAGEESTAFTGADAVRAWREVDGGRTPLRARVAFVSSAAAGRPARASFFTCGGRAHPSAPLTGLAVVALAAERLPWLDLGDAGHVWTRAGPMPLPRVETTRDGTARVEFPDVIVDLSERIDRP